MDAFLKTIKNNRGVTLLELVISMVISILVLGAAAIILLTQSGTIRLTRSVSTEQQRLNVAYHALRYNLSMAGFDYGQNYFIQSGTVPPVQTVAENYSGNNNPYEVFITYSSMGGQGMCTLTQNSGSINSTSANLDFTASCSDNFYIGETVLLLNPVPLSSGSTSIASSSSISLCITGYKASGGQYGYGRIQTNPGNDQSCGNAINPTPPNNISNAGTNSVTSIKQILFYWGSSTYPAPQIYDSSSGSLSASSDNFPGNLYECQVSIPVLEPGTYSGISNYTAPSCLKNTVQNLSSNIYSFSVTPTANMTAVSNYNDGSQYYSYDITISAGSDVSISSSPAYSVHTPYNPGTGQCYQENTGQIIKVNCPPQATNIFKTIHSNVMLRNVYYGS